MAGPLFGVDFKDVIGAVFAGQLHALTLHKLTLSTGPAGDTLKASTDHVAEGLVTTWNARVAVAKGYTPQTVKVLVLQKGLAPTPTVDDEITADGRRWRVVDVSRDPGGATWALAAVPAGGA